MRHSACWLAALAGIACGGATGKGPPPEALDKARTTLAPAGPNCPDEVGDTRPVVIVTKVGRAKTVGRVSATRFHRDEDAACAWAEDGAATAARRLGADTVVIQSRRAADADDLVRCTVEARALLRGEGEMLRPCKREEIRGVRDPEEG